MNIPFKQNSIGYFNLKQFSAIVRFLTLVDVLVAGGFGLITPILAVFITDNIPGANLETVGIASTIFLLTKSLAQIPIGGLIDHIKGEIDDYLILFIGITIYSMIPIFYIFVSSPTQLYFVQFIYGLAGACAYPAWMAVFTRHIDKEHEGVEWSVYATMVEFTMAMAASLSGFIALRYGFNSLFILSGIVIFLSNFFVLLAYYQIKKKHSSKNN